MIILNSKKRNTKFKEIIHNYVKVCNFGLLECPHCGSTHIIKWGTYERNVIFFNENGTILEAFLLTVQRVKCKSCNKTHALLPFGIIPYKQFSDEVISKILLELLSSNIDDVSSKYSIDSSVIKRWMHQMNYLGAEPSIVHRTIASFQERGIFTSTLSSAINFEAEPRGIKP